MNKKPIVAIDLDDVCWEFVIPLLDKYNLRYDDWVSYGDIVDWDIHKFLKPECENIFEEFCTEGFFEELFIPASVSGWLSALNVIADIKFVSACASETVPWRAALLRRELDFYTDNMLVKLKDKELIKADYLVDDNADNCKNFDGRTFLISRPWNGYEGCSTDEALSKIVMEILRGREH